MPLDRHLSPSQAGLWLKCGLAWEFRYIQGIKDPPRGAMIRGTALDQAATIHFRKKAKDKEGLRSDEFVDAAVEAHRKQANEYAIEWDMAVGQSQDVVAKAAVGYFNKAGVQLVPRSEQDVQRRWEADLDDWKVVGITDLVTAQGVVVDTKLKAQVPSQSDLDRDLQLGTYAWLTGARDLALAVAQPSGKTSIVFTERESEQIERTKLLYSYVKTCITAGIAHPAVPDAWWCSAKWCGYWNRCPLGGKK